MQIIWNQEAAQQLMKSHTVLELETFDVEGKHITGWCVVPAEKIIMEIGQLDSHKQQHAELIATYNNKQYKESMQIANDLIGKFGGELDSFYTTIIEKSQTNLDNE